MRTIAVLAAAFALAVLTLPAGASPAATGTIAFERRTGTGVGELFLVGADGTGLRRLGAGRSDFDPAWSPDGKRIAFASARSGGAGAHELFVAKADGTGARRLTHRVLRDGAWTSDAAPAWSPDEKCIVFVRLDVRGSSSQTDLWIVGANGSGLRRLTRTAGPEADPAWNGRALAFERDGTIYSLRLAGDGSPRGAAQAIGRGSEPAFAPRGNGPFAYVRDGGVYATLGEHVMRVATGSAPAWSPDGSRIVYSTSTGLFSVRPDGSDRRRVTRAPELTHHLAPAWRRR